MRYALLTTNSKRIVSSANIKDFVKNLRWWWGAHLINRLPRPQVVHRTQLISDSVCSGYISNSSLQTRANSTTSRYTPYARYVICKRRINKDIHHRYETLQTLVMNLITSWLWEQNWRPTWGIRKYNSMGTWRAKNFVLTQDLDYTFVLRVKSFCLSVTVQWEASGAPFIQKNELPTQHFTSMKRGSPFLDFFARQVVPYA